MAQLQIHEDGLRLSGFGLRRNNLTNCRPMKKLE